MLLLPIFTGELAFKVPILIYCSLTGVVLDIDDSDFLVSVGTLNHLLSYF